MSCYRSRIVSFVTFKTPDISQGSVVTHLRCGRIFSDSNITNFLLVLKNNFEIGYKANAYKKLCHFFGPPCITYKWTTSACIITQNILTKNMARSYKKNSCNIKLMVFSWLIIMCNRHVYKFSTVTISAASLIV